MAGLELDTMARSETLTERVYREMRRALMEGVFAPGDRLTIRNLAARMEVSPTPIREAVNALLKEGALTQASNRTVCVPVPSTAQLSEWVEIRVALEGLAVTRATKQISPLKLNEIIGANDALAAATRAGEYKKAMRFNRAFHFTIYGASQMPTLVAMIESLWLRTAPLLNFIYPQFAFDSEGADNHARIIEGLKARDPERTRVAAEIEIRYAAKLYLAALRAHANLS